MSRRPPISRWSYWQLALVAAAVAVVVAVLGHLHAAFPQRQLEPILEGVESVRGEELERITCRRTLPDRPSRPQGTQTPEAVGLIRSSEVVSCPDVFDPTGDGGPIVRYVGEVVGDVLRRDGGGWVLMNDDGYGLETGPLPAHQRYQGTNSGLTVWLPADVADLATLRPGRPDHRGDVLAVVGRLHRTDPADGGGLTLRAEAVDVVAPARQVAQPLHHRQAALAALVAAIAAGAALAVRASDRSYVR